MKAMVIEKLGPVARGSQPLRRVELSKPSPGPGEVLIRVTHCGVCRTDLDEIEGRTAPPRLPVIPGHQVIGHVCEVGAAVSKHKIGQRVGVGWIHSSTGKPDENLAPEFRGTGRDVHGGYAEYMTVPENYTYPIPDVFGDAEAAPLLCAGAVGFRALRLTKLQSGGRLGLTGFGGSAHLVLQTARHLFPDSFLAVFARDDASRRFALSLGADWAGDTSARPPQPLDAVIDTTPAWKPVVEALASLAPGGALVINAISKQAEDQEQLLRISYQQHLWMEKSIRTVANVTRFDIADFLPIAAEVPLHPTVEIYPLEDANRALNDLKYKPVRGAKVLQIAET